MPEIIKNQVEQNKLARPLFSKIHNLYTEKQLGFISKENTLGIIYIVRNPLAIAPSFANHQVKSIDDIIQSMNDPNTVSYTHLRSPRDATLSRMPSSA